MAIMRRGETPPPARRTREWDPFQTMRELTGWDPFREMTMPRQWRGAEDMAFVPEFDVRESKDAYIFKADLPGFREDDVEINVTGNRLTVSGKREEEHEEESDTQYVSERAFGSFTRSFTLPDGVDPNQVSAKLNDGVLTIRIQKNSTAQPKRIQLRGGQSEGSKVKA
jgi:HSP20 family protein